MLIAAVGLLVMTLAGWSLYQGFRTGAMKARGSVNGNRDRNPFMFWFCAVYNVIFFIGGGALIHSQLAPWVPN